MNVRELRVYGHSVKLRRAIFEMSKGWPKEERYALTDQARRSSRSISANLAEAWAKRRYPKHFVSKLTDALGEAEETVVWLEVAEECGYLTSEAHAVCAETARQLVGGLIKMMRHPEKWCGPATLVREAPTDYSVTDFDPDKSSPD